MKSKITSSVLFNAEFNEFQDLLDEMSRAELKNHLFYAYGLIGALLEKKGFAYPMPGGLVYITKKPKK